MHNDREKKRQATLIIGMNGATTEIKDPQNLKQDPKRFAFDFSYWSHDQFKERSDGYFEPSNSKYADQVSLSLPFVVKSLTRDNKYIKSSW